MSMKYPYKKKSTLKVLLMVFRESQRRVKTVKREEQYKERKRKSSSTERVKEDPNERLWKLRKGGRIYYLKGKSKYVRLI